MRFPGEWLVLGLVGALAALGGCTARPASTPLPSAVTATTPPAGSGPAAATAAAATAQPDAVAFFRAQEAGCARHAAARGNPPVESDRFAGATLVRALGGGAYLVADGRGTRLVVDPGEGVVRPESGRTGDVMPAPYGFGCPEAVFLGAAD